MSENSNDSRAVLWWVGWIVLTLVSFFVCAYFWTGIIAKYVGPISKPGVSILWVAAVFGSWMVLLVPLIVVMYNKVDKAYEDARMSRETRQATQTQSELGVRSVDIESSHRILSKELREKIKSIPQAIPRGHLVTVILKNGKKIHNVFIRDKKEILGVYDTSIMGFQIGDIADLEPSNLDRLPAFKPEKWLRLDGVGTPVYNS